ncbi:MAG: UvrD-helicase domain-containing protein [Clostridia bacterium]|nr:UvrD-helicase domain-containing protein [Clostridia bacterium]
MVIKMLNERFLAAKRALFNRLYSNLNPQQREAVFTVNGPLLILAGAGSGKTTVLVARIAQILRYGNAYHSNRIPSDLSEEEVKRLEDAVNLDDSAISLLLDKYAENPAPAWSVLSITFTNKAANEMKTRLEKKVGTTALDIWAGTFHSICVRLLRRFGERIGYAPGFTIYDTEDVKKMVIGVIRDLRMDEKMYPPRTVQNYISRSKDSLLTPDDAEAEASGFREKELVKIYREYQSRMRAANAVDFDDIIMQTVMLLRTDEEVLSYCQNRFRYVCVDEYQDTNRAQFVLTELISAKRRNIMVVGDDDQSIYRFRGADIQNILDFDKVIEDARVIKLEQNYRSTANILEVANSNIRNNTERHDKTLFTTRSGGEKVMIKQVATQIDEAKYIVDKIIELKKSENRSLSDFAVLYRVHARSGGLEGAFARSGIPYRVLGGLRFFERKEIKDVVAYLCLINNPADNLHLTRIINEPKRKIGETTVSAVAELAKLEECSMFDIMENAYQYASLQKSASKLIEFTKMILALREIAETESLPDLVDKVLEMTGYREMLVLGGKETEDKLENCEELISNAVEYMSRNPDGSLSSFLEEAALIADIDNYDPEAEAVVLMTVHSAKGLEFPVVFLPGLEEGVFPSSQSTSENEELEEERRLAYVAVTRAKDRLFCIHAKERLLYGRTSYNRVSRFVEEIPNKYAENESEPRVIRNPFAGSSASKRSSPTLSDAMISRPTVAQTTKKQSLTKFHPGDSVKHPTFGIGMVISAQDIGSDMLYEIAFETVGTKKMMATYAKLTPAN